MLTIFCQPNFWMGSVPPPSKVGVLESLLSPPMLYIASYVCICRPVKCDGSLTYYKYTFIKLITYVLLCTYIYTLHICFSYKLHIMYYLDT